MAQSHPTLLSKTVVSYTCKDGTHFEIHFYLRSDASTVTYTEPCHADPFAGHNWIESVQVEIYTNDSVFCGHCHGTLLRRQFFTKSLDDHLASIDSSGYKYPELSLMAEDLLDDRGKRRKDFKLEQGLQQSKKEVISLDELEDADIAVVELIAIDKSVQRRGVGRAIVQTLLEQIRCRCAPEGFVMLARPEVIVKSGRTCEVMRAKGRSEEEIGGYLQEQASVPRMFWQGVGFRRFSNSVWFGFVGDTK
ncbi:uncharacterized protein BCR38DRAFT_490964 [Pseudomassariella vexata]|uniref:Uncharacterized protein n=1 Tax=Pseudomassariella vexata TaxID=1141098 RepID=A0A1Y2D8N5_9PEZI|nr:uncharacterized protein BCR38DRAFT_490964 [Pseudomassariella vexata]ORY55622.1 hypothetical protein BCR38DRAFT_490964 [Pseudomassariella vexata]